jgi:hypothetical protein
VYAVVVDTGTYDFFKNPPDYLANALLVPFNLLVNCPLAQVVANVATQQYIDQLAPAQLTWSIGLSGSKLTFNTTLSHPLFGTQAWSRSYP